VKSGAILLIRHGETEWNLQRRFQGRSDSPLTERGIAQAHAVGQFLSSLPAVQSAELVASPQGRARRTAEIIAEHLPAARELRFDDRLRELSLGCWDGLIYSEIAEQCPGVFDGDGRYQWYFHSPDGEHYDVFASRLNEWLREWVAHSLVVVVTHGIVTRVLRGLYAGLPQAIAMTLPVPQDRIFRLSGGVVDELCTENRSQLRGAYSSCGSKSSTVPPPITPLR
jgi:broad specificity phosphatase PhoE